MSRTSLVALLVVVATLVLPTQVAFACSCVEFSEAEHRARADAVFVATVTGVTDPKEGDRTVSSGDPLRWHVAVEAVEKGEAGTEAVVASARSGASCGFEFSVGARYRVYAMATPNAVADFETGLCSGTTQVAAQEPAPDATPTAESSPSALPTSDSSAAPPDRLASTGAPLVLVAVVGLGLLAAGAGARRRRT